MSEPEIRAKVKRIFGVSSPFSQGNSLVLTIPKRAVEELHLTEKVSQNYFGFIFVDTDKGLFLLPLDKAVTSDSLRNALRFINASGLTDEDLEAIFREKE